MHSIKYWLISVSSVILWFCTQENNHPAGKTDYINSIKEWHDTRIASLKKPDSWLTLAGLFWLQEGENTFGSSQSADIVFPAKTSPDILGTIFLNGQKVSIRIASAAQVFYDAQPIDSMTLIPDSEGSPTTLNSGTLSWYIIKRGNRHGIRLKDSAHPNLKKFKGIPTYPIDAKWRIRSKLESYNPPKTIPVPNVLGDINNESCPGALVFVIDHDTCRLDPIAEPGDAKYFIIFADETNGEETYGAGRFLSVDTVNDSGYTWIDFNKAYNPPCAFTEFATCPLPPIQNRLPLKITAGEKDYHGAAH